MTHTLKAEGFDASTQFGDIAGSLTARHDSSPCADRGMNVVAQPVPVAFHPTQDPISSTDGSTHALGCGSKGGQASVAVAVPLQEVGKRTGVSTDNPRAGIGIGQDGDPMFTLQAGAQHGVAAYAFQPRIARNGRGDMGDVVNALNAQSGETGKGDAAPCVAVADTTEQTPKFNEEQALTLTKQSPTGGGQPQAVMQQMAVRRLTPRECERLQGFPDDYTMIPWRKKPASECPDGPRYKALGNSMAVPCMRWIGRRISDHLCGNNLPKPGNNLPRTNSETENKGEHHD